MLKNFYYWLYRLVTGAEVGKEVVRGYWMEKVRRAAASLCKEAKGKLLEVACGTGMFLQYAATINPRLELYGIDNSLDNFSRENAQLYFPPRAKISSADALSLPFSDESFDIVVCINTLYIAGSLETAKRIIKEIARVCRRGGKIILDFRNLKNPILHIKYKFAKYYDGKVDSYIYRRDDPPQFYKTLEGLGLTVVEKIEIGFSPFKNCAPVVVLECRKQ